MQKKHNISTKKKLAIGVSGTGTTFLAIANAVKAGQLKYDISFIFADRNCLALEKAKKLGIKIVQKKKSEDINKFHERIVEKLEKDGVDIVVLAGYLRLFPVTNKDKFITLNSHPAAIPYFGGKGMWGHFVHEAVLEWASATNYDYPYTFSTIHIASAVYDKGPVVGVRRCRILKKDTPETLSARLLPLEHQNYLAVLKKFERGIPKEVNYPKEFLAVIKKSKKAR